MTIVVVAITGWLRKTGPPSHCKYSEIPWPNWVEIGELLQHYMLKSICTMWINDSNKHFRYVAPQRDEIFKQKVNVCVQHIILQKFTNFHAIRSWNFQNICNEIWWPCFCATLYFFSRLAIRRLRPLLLLLMLISNCTILLGLYVVICTRVQWRVVVSWMSRRK